MRKLKNFHKNSPSIKKGRMKVALFLALVIFSGVALADNKRERDEEFDIELLVRQAYKDDISFLDSVSIRYGQFSGPLSYSSGSLGVLNASVLPLVGADIVNFWAPRTTPNFYYLEVSGTGGINYNMSGIVPIANALTAFMVGAKMYGQEHYITDVSVNKISATRYQAWAKAILKISVANPALYPPGSLNFPTTLSQTITVELASLSYNEYLLVHNEDGSLGVLLDNHKGYFRSQAVSGPLASRSFLTYDQYPGFPLEYPLS